MLVKDAVGSIAIKDAEGKKIGTAIQDHNGNLVKDSQGNIIVEDVKGNIVIQDE